MGCCRRRRGRRWGRGGGIVWEISLKSDSELSRGLEYIRYLDATRWFSLITLGRARVRPVPFVQPTSMSTWWFCQFLSLISTATITGSGRRGTDEGIALENVVVGGNLPTREMYLIDTLPTLLLLYQYTICDFWCFAESFLGGPQCSRPKRKQAPCNYFLPVNPPHLCSENVQYILCDMQTSSLAGRVGHASSKIFGYL